MQTGVHFLVRGDHRLTSINQVLNLGVRFFSLAAEHIEIVAETVALPRNAWHFEVRPRVTLGTGYAEHHH